MAKKPRLPKPWPVSFDETHGIWTITGDDAGHAFPLAAISCPFDEHNGQRRHGSHLMANAKGMYHYTVSVSVSDRGDSTARSLLDGIRVAMMARDAEDRVMQSSSRNPR
jgi:hypothetical protein